MSYTEICDKFEGVIRHLRKGGYIMTNICTFFKHLKKTQDQSISNTQKIGENFIEDLQSGMTLDTLSSALSSLSANQKQLLSIGQNFSQSLQMDIVEPLELFVEHYTGTNSALSQKGIQAYKQLHKARERMEKLKSKYYQASAAAERAEESKDKEKSFRQAQNLRANANRACELYMDSVRQVNQKWDEYDCLMPGIMESLQQSEESRIHFLKYSLEKYVKHYKRLLEESMNTLEELSVVLGNINSNIDVRVFVDACKSKNCGVVRENFVSYEEHKELKNQKQEESLREEEYEFIDEDSANQEADVKAVKNILNFLIPKQRNSVSSSSDSELSENNEDLPSKKDYSRVSDLLQHPDGRGLFCEVLEHKKNQTALTYESTAQLAAFIKNMFTSMVMENDHDPIVFCKVVVLSHVFYSEDENGKRKYLSQFLANHNIWNDRIRWEQAIETAIMAKVASDKEYSQRFRSQRKGKGLLGTLKNIASKVPSVFQKDLQEERSEKASAFMVISQFIFHMIHFGMSLELSSTIVLNCSHKFNLDSERTCVLLAELQASQNTSVTLESSSRISERLRRKERNYWGEFMHLGLAMEFLESQDCMSLLLVNKDWNLKLTDAVYKKALLNFQEENETKAALRNKVWRKKLRVDSNPVEYSAFLSHVSANPKIIGDLNDVIDMDVTRSYHNHPKVSHQSLRNVLKTYAFYNPDVGYCQGMNYLVGTLFIVFQDEEATFKALIALIERFQMNTLFVSKLPKLKQFFYQLDRLLGILLPEVHEVFREVAMCSGHFASPWFITLFASLLNDRPRVLYPLWDMFIYEGWKGVFMAAIAILTKVSQHIVSGKFEDIMALMSCIHSRASPVEVFDEEFPKRVQSISLSNEMLRHLETEYEHLKLRATNKQKQANNL